MPVIHNQGKKMGDKTVARKIIFPKGWDKDGHPLKEGKKIITETLMPGQHRNVTDEQLKHLKDNFGSEIININDIEDMQAQFKETPPEKPREGYLSPEEVEAVVAKRLEEQAAKTAKTVAMETREEMILRIDGMDRGDLIALIEKEELAIEHKSLKKPGELKAAILAAMEKREHEAAAAKTAAEEA